MPGAESAAWRASCFISIAWRAPWESSIALSATSRLTSGVVSWTITLDCPDQRRCQSSEGRLPADDESDTVTVVFAGLEADTRYQYTVEASSPAGATRFSGEFESIPPGAAPEGAKDEEVYTPPELPWANQSGNEAEP